MSEADKMFEELGYIQYHEDNEDLNEIWYENANNKNKAIGFHKKQKYIEYFGEVIEINVLKAINTKVKELGWYE